MHISHNGLILIESFEGWSSTPYWDPYGGVWTIGYGQTEGIGPRSPALSRAQGEANLRRLVERRYEYAINALGRALTQTQWDALCSVIWNLGPGIIGPGTQLGDLLRERRDRGFADALLAYDHAGGLVLEGLRRRREAERALFDSEPSQPHGVLTSLERRSVERFDALHRSRRRHPVAFRKVRNELIVLRRAIWTAAERGRVGGKAVRKGWGVAHRAQRYSILWSRTN